MVFEKTATKFVNTRPKLMGTRTKNLGTISAEEFAEGRQHKGEKSLYTKPGGPKTASRTVTLGSDRG